MSDPIKRSENDLEVSFEAREERKAKAADLINEANRVAKKIKFQKNLPWLILVALVLLLIGAVIFAPGFFLGGMNAIRTLVYRTLPEMVPTISTTTDVCTPVHVQIDNDEVAIQPFPVVGNVATRWCISDAQSLLVWKKLLDNTIGEPILIQKILDESGLGAEYGQAIRAALRGSYDSGEIVFAGVDNWSFSPEVTPTPGEIVPTSAPVAEESIVIPTTDPTITPTPTVTLTPTVTPTPMILNTQIQWNVEDLQDFFDEFGTSIPWGASLVSEKFDCGSLPPLLKMNYTRDGGFIFVDMSFFEPLRSKIGDQQFCKIVIYDNKPANKELSGHLFEFGGVWLYPYSQP